MKKGFLAVILATATLFVTAIGVCVRALFGAQTVSADGETNMTIVLDAGHGGIDGGVSGRTTGIKESDINLSVTLMLKEELEDAGFTVVLTRKTEAGLYGVATKGFKRRDMEKRREIIREAKPLAVISVHQNFYPLQSSRGAQVFYSKGAEKGSLLAKSLQDCLNELYQTQSVKGRKAAAGKYYVLECYDCPSVIVECGFLSNVRDETLLRSLEWQRKLAKSVASGVLRYFSVELS